MACGLSITNTSQCGYNFDGEQVGQEILANLHTDREKIQRARERRDPPPPTPHSTRQSLALPLLTSSQPNRQRAQAPGPPPPTLYHMYPWLWQPAPHQPRLPEGRKERWKKRKKVTVKEGWEERLRETDANLGKSSRILTGMLRR
ncbi:hypothetical protein INR49_005586 [Caranx melampygus]|nr:hypothetical protein INR49_005586 [Caranx melampygus]